MATKDYPTTGITIHWNPSICQHSGVCAKTLPTVFRPSERPWIDPNGATADDIADTIDNCPSRALTYTRTTVEVVHKPERTRYEILVDARLAGFAHYTVVEGCYVFDHTVIKDEFGHQGLGSALARGALDDVRAQHVEIVALCPFIVGWLDRHPDYADLVDEDLTDRVSAN